MSKRTKIGELPTFDADQQLNSDEAVTAYLTDSAATPR